MQAADTNIWARAYLNDDTQQSPLARVTIDEACASEGLFVPILVLAELFWVLRRTWQKERVLDTLEHILRTDGAVVESKALAEQAIRDARVGGAGFADLLIASTALAHGAYEVLTFDKAFARQPHVRRLH